MLTNKLNEIHKISNDKITNPRQFGNILKYSLKIYSPYTLLVNSHLKSDDKSEAKEEFD